MASQPPGLAPHTGGVSGYLLGDPSLVVPSVRGDPQRSAGSSRAFDHWRGVELTVVARPVAEDYTLRVRDAALNEMRDVAEAQDRRTHHGAAGRLLQQDRAGVGRPSR